MFRSMLPASRYVLTITKATLVIDVDTDGTMMEDFEVIDNNLDW